MGGRGRSKLASNLSVYRNISQLNGQALRGLDPGTLRQAVREGQDDQTSRVMQVSDLVNAAPNTWGEYGNNLFPDLVRGPTAGTQVDQLLLGTLRAARGHGVTRISDGALQAIVQALQTGQNATLRRTRSGVLVSSVANAKLYEIDGVRLNGQIGHYSQ